MSGDGAVGRVFDVPNPFPSTAPASDGGSSTTGMGIGDMFGTRWYDGGRSVVGFTAGGFSFGLPMCERGWSGCSFRISSSAPDFSSPLLSRPLRSRQDLRSATPLLRPRSRKCSLLWLARQYGSKLSPVLTRQQTPPHKRQKCNTIKVVYYSDHDAAL